MTQNMVSTRGVKLKFSENERVLCYEPDPTKAKVLYDSKVLDVVISKDHRGRKTVEYLIHFQGWNSSWDRYVSEEYVLKDTPENRQLQKTLADKSQLQIGAYLYRKDRRKHSTKASTVQSSDDGSSGSPTRMDTDDGQGGSSSSDDDSSVDEELIHVELSQELRACLEQDYFLITTKNKLVKLPAEPNVITILESYWKHYVTSQLYDLNEKTSVRSRYPFGSHTTKRQPEDIRRNLMLCSEVLDGIRIYFDFTVKELLLYKAEQGQFETGPAIHTAVHSKKDDNCKPNVDYLDYITCPSNYLDDDYQSDKAAVQRKRTLRSNKSSDGLSNGYAEGNKTKASSSQENLNSEGNNATKSIPLRLLPKHVYSQEPPPPCLVYGATHLARLFVKLPELLNASNIEENKWKALLHHLESFADFLNDHKEWFGEKFYIDKQS